MRKLALSLLAAVLFTGGNVSAEAFHFNAGIDDKNIAHVTETIELPAGQGLNRSLSTYHTSGIIGQTRVDTFEVNRVKLNGAEVPFELIPFSQGVKVTAAPVKGAQKNTYEIKYKTSGLIRHYSNKDELYANIFEYQPSTKADSVKIELSFPKNIDNMADVRLLSGAAGSLKDIQGATVEVAGKNLTVSIPSNSEEGLLLSVSVPKGVLAKVSAADEINKLWRKNKMLISGAVGLCFILLYYVLIWLFLGVYTKKYIPDSKGIEATAFSPAEVRYLYKKIPGQIADKFKTLTATVLEMAVRGALKIVKAGNVYELHLIDKTKIKGPVETLVLEAFFPKTQNVFTADNMTTKEMKNLVRNIKRTVFKKMFSKYITSNKPLVNLGYILTILYIFWAVLYLYATAPLYTCFYIILAVILAVTFTKMLNPFNKDGRHAMEQIETFRKYLMSIPEETGDTENTLDLFERYVAYAVALGVENKWGRRFASRFTGISNTDTKLHWVSIPVPQDAPDIAAFISSELGTELLKSFTHTSNVASVQVNVSAGIEK